MINRIFLIVILFALSLSNILLSQNISFKVTGISGIAFIEKTDINKSLRAFRGSEVHSEYRLRTISNTQVELTLSRRGDKIGEITVPQNTIILVNPPLTKDDSTISLSLLEGYISVSIIKDMGTSIEIHTANTSSIVKGTEFEVAFAENGSSIVILKDGNVDIVTDNDETVLNPKEAYINTIDNNYKVVNQNSDSDPIVFLNRGEEDSREDFVYTIENLITAMENIPNNNNNEDNFVSFTSMEMEENEKKIKELELKQQRMTAANEGYYNTIIKLINLNSDKKNEMISYARKSLSIYMANQRAISKMNNAVYKTREKFDRIKRKFDERMNASAYNQ
ncbi:FecR domain-containing protein [uncultured Brachyspira sp.]|uniref:FecR domain-containing protein n=1 Tax=uncultured Brachyspira sp. TaxID=221953 RepID=UPI0026183824|nr:FecR domain-containing protein [uncultured Brachyspira sp.]